VATAKVGIPVKILVQRNGRTVEVTVKTGNADSISTSRKLEAPAENSGNR
jgi:hypothetical protein